MGDLVNEQGFDGAFGWLECEAKLFFENGKERWVGGVLRFFRSPFDLEVEVALEVGMVFDRTASLRRAAAMSAIDIFVAFIMVREPLS